MRMPTLPRNCSQKLIDLIKDSSSYSKWRQVLCHYREAKRAGLELEFSHPTLFHLIIKACSNVSFVYGTSLHGCLIKKGLESHTSISNSVMNFYVKAGYLDSARVVLRCLGNRDSVSWNILVRGYLDQGDLELGLCLFEKARLDEFEPNYSTLVLVIQSCRSLGTMEEGKRLHGFVIKSGLFAVDSVKNSFLSMYSESEMDSALKLFDEMTERDVISWSTLIKGYVYSGEPKVGLKMFFELVSQNIGVEPDEVTLVSVLKACASLSDITMGRFVHSYAIHRGFDSDMFVGNSLIDMYSKCHDPNSAFDVFNYMDRRNKVSWNSITSGFVFNGKHSEALSLLSSMSSNGVEMDEVSIVSVLQIYKHFVEPLGLRSVHCVNLRKGYEMNEVVLNSLIDSYSKCSLIDYARKIFQRIDTRSEVLWSTMIAGLTHDGSPDDAIMMFHEMVRSQVKPNAVTIINLLDACSVLAELKRSKCAHAIATRRGLSTEVAVGTTILDMYSKCGEIETSVRVFNQMPERNIVTWSAMIYAYGMNGLARQAVALHDEMKMRSVTPNEVTTLCVLSACSHGGLIEEGISFFNSMARDHGIEPRLEHYSCVVDMLGRAGRLDTAMEFIKKMPQGFRSNVEANAWGSLLSACKSYGNIKLGLEAETHVLELEPTDSTGYLMASSVYASGGLWVEASNVRRLVKERGMKVGGYSVVHIGNTSYKFVAGDYSRSKVGDINSMVEFLHTSIVKMYMEMDFGVLRTECRHKLSNTEMDFWCH